MPQKKNPDVAELARGRTGRVYGHLMALLTTMKALPLAYNRDMQEDKQGLFDTVDTLLSTLEVFTGMIKTVRIKTENTVKAVERGYILATDLADYLVERGRPFRTAHGIAAKIVRICMERGVSLSNLCLDELRGFDEAFDESVYDMLDPRRSIERRSSQGGTATSRVRAALEEARQEILQMRRLHRRGGE